MVDCDVVRDGIGRWMSSIGYCYVSERIKDLKILLGESGERMKPIMLSIKHIHCEKILERIKKSELRLHAPFQPTPYRMFLYDSLSSGGSGKVVGECCVYDAVSWRMCVGIPSHLAETACVTNDEIWRYCHEGQKDIHELRLIRVKRYDKPKELSEFGLKRPPQSWCYVEEE